MAAPLTYRLLPDPDVHDLLARTLERVNKACNGARTRALTQRATGKAEVKTLVKEELDKFKLPITFSTAATDRVLASLTKQKFGTYQSLVLPPTAVKWPASDRVTLPTASGKRTIKVYLDPGQGESAAAARRQGDRARVPQRGVRARRRVGTAAGRADVGPALGPRLTTAA